MHHCIPFGCAPRLFYYASNQLRIKCSIMTCRGVLVPLLCQAFVSEFVRVRVPQTSLEEARKGVRRSRLLPIKRFTSLCLRHMDSDYICDIVL